MSGNDCVENQVHCIVHFFIINLSSKRNKATTKQEKKKVKDTHCVH